MRPFAQWVRGIYYIDEKQFHTRAWYDNDDCPEASPVGGVVKGRSKLIQIKCFIALVDAGLIAADAEHVRDSNNEKTMRMLRKPFV